MYIGIITFHWAHNYGAVLQTYALQEVLSRQGHVVEIIDYRPSWATDLKKRNFPQRPGEAINLVDHWFRKYTFGKFCKKYLHLTKKKYHFGDNIQGFDCVITGSDQVFNPDIIASGGFLDTTYLLSSVADSTKKISYAASFGNSTLEEEYKVYFRKLLPSFCNIGIREESGKLIVKDLGLNANFVPDPTILLGDFSALVNKPSKPKEDYVLNLIFQNSSMVQMVQQVILEESQLQKMTIPNLIEKVKGDNGKYNLSPQQWIKVISNAHFVITDSFHSTVFCILNHRPFVSLALDAWGNDWSERIRSLLSRLGLQDRLIVEFSPDAVRKVYHATIDWNEIDGILEEWRAEGIKFLDKLIDE